MNTNVQTVTPAMSPISKAVVEFNTHIFNHRIAKRTFKDLGAALGAVSSPQIIILTGPTGVGKSTLADRARDRLIAGNSKQLNTEPDFVPVVRVNAVAPTTGTFSWKDFYIRLLTGQNEPLVERKLLVNPQAAFFPNPHSQARGLEHSVSDALRRSVEQYLRLRRTKLLFIDEAQHLLMVNGPHRLECQFECLKSLAIQTGVTILLSGTYRLLDILDLSGQLTRRSQVVHFPRYDLRSKEDREDYRKALVFLESKLAAHVPAALDVNADYFYRMSAGCIGILKDWLARCLENALLEQAPIIDAAFAERFAITNRGVATIVEEACSGEARLMDASDDYLTDLLNNGVLLAGSKTKTIRTSHRPGKRNPTRDLVGEMRV